MNCPNCGSSRTRQVNLAAGSCHECLDCHKCFDPPPSVVDADFAHIEERVLATTPERHLVGYDLSWREGSGALQLTQHWQLADGTPLTVVTADPDPEQLRVVASTLNQAKTREVRVEQFYRAPLGQVWEFRSPYHEKLTKKWDAWERRCLRGHRQTCPEGTNCVCQQRRLLSVRVDLSARLRLALTWSDGPEVLDFTDCDAFLRMFHAYERLVNSRHRGGGFVNSIVRSITDQCPQPGESYAEWVHRTKYRNHKVHRPSLGPDDSHCLDCGVPRSQWASISEPCVPIDTSDIPEVGEDWFRRARLVQPAAIDPHTDLDDAVRAARANTAHDFGTVTTDDATFEACTRCGKRQDELRLPDGSYIPCRGFI